MRAGPVEALLLDGDLRYVRHGGTELARRIQVAVRSADWGTVPGVRSSEQVEQNADGFRVTFDSVHRHGELEFRWVCTIDGAADGKITYTMDGVAERDFPYRRIGLCVLHPSDVFAGGAFEAGSSLAHTTGELPASVGPQRFDGETYPPLFDAFDRLQMTARDGVTVQYAFEGDVFEMEDQRNWTDASFKTYSQNPLSRVEPWQLTAGAKLRQKRDDRQPGRRVHDRDGAGAEREAGRAHYRPCAGARRGARGDRAGAARDRAAQRAGSQPSAGGPASRDRLLARGAGARHRAGPAARLRARARRVRPRRPGAR